MSQMTLGQIIDRLQQVGQDKTCIIEGSVSGNPYYVDSYRGYYNQLAISPSLDEDVPVAHVIRMLESAVYNTYQGYKGGYYTMTPNTDVWVADYGLCDADAIVEVVEEPYAVVLRTEKRGYGYE